MLSFKEKRAIQKEIKAHYENLGSGELGFKAKREVQKAIKDLYVKLGEKADLEAGIAGVENELETIRSVLENKNATYEDYKQLEEAVSVVEKHEDQLADNMLYQEVINLLEDLVDDGTVADSIFGGLNKDTIDMDKAKNKVREFMTYQAWKRAVKKIDPHAEFTGDKDIDGAFRRDAYDAEWDGEVGQIIMMDSAAEEWVDV
ncbi:MAG: hypothetical protein ABXS91_08660 [Sulfurimonas sp.]